MSHSARRATAILCLVLVASTAGAAALLSVAWSLGDTPEELIRELFALVGAAACLRYALAALAGLLASVGSPGARRRSARVLATVGPRWITRLSAASLGTAALLTPVVAVAAPVGQDVAHDPPAATVTTEIHGLLTSPTAGTELAGTLGQKVRTSTSTSPPAAVAAPDPAEMAEVGEVVEVEPVPEAATYVVQAGDSLWAIAVAHGATSDAEAAQQWPRWYELNRDAIGADPDLIHPGQVLRVPEPAVETATAGALESTGATP